MSFDGTNPRSVVIESTGALIIFLPPYNPDLNPIEETFASFKSYLRTHEDSIHSDNDLQEVMMYAFASVTAESCRAWFKNCGY